MSTERDMHPEVHPLAPEPGSAEEGPGPTDNSPQTVRVRGGVEVGAMRYVLLAGLVLAVGALLLGLFARG